MIIGLAGLAGSGKDTVGEILRDQHLFGLISFAHPIKKMICESLLGVSVDKWNDRAWREAPIGGAFRDKTPRYLAQTLGTEWGRDLVADDLWLEYALDKYLGEFPDLAITDLRFSNEAHRIRSLKGGYVVHVKRDVGAPHAWHPSERGVPETAEDWIIKNNGTLEQLIERVERVVNMIDEDYHAQWGTGK